LQIFKAKTKKLLCSLPHMRIVK